MSTMAAVVNGLLRPDGTLQLDAPPCLPPGRVRVTVQLLEEPERLPDAAWLDDAIPAPFDLPRAGAVERVHPRVVNERLPDFLTVVEEPE